MDNKESSEVDWIVVRKNYLNFNPLSFLLTSVERCVDSTNPFKI